MREKWKSFAKNVRNSNGRVWLSAIIMGGGQLLYGRWVKGLLYLLAEIIILCYFITRGGKELAGFFTLGTTQGDAWLGIQETTR